MDQHEGLLGLKARLATAFDAWRQLPRKGLLEPSWQAIGGVIPDNNYMALRNIWGRDWR